MQLPEPTLTASVTPETYDPENDVIKLQTDVFLF